MAENQKPLTEDEKARLRKFPELVAKKAIVDYLTAIVEIEAKNRGLFHLDKKMAAKNGRANEFAEYRRIADKLARIHPEDSVCIETGYKNETGTKLRFIAGVFENGHTLNFEIEENLIPAVFAEMDKMVMMIRQFYGAFIQQNNATILVSLADFFPDIDCSQMQIDKNSRAMCLDPKFGKFIMVDIYTINGETGERIYPAAPQVEEAKAESQ